MYRNKSKIFEVCNEMLNLMNSGLYFALMIYYAYDIFNANDSFKAALKSKAEYMKTDKVIIENNDDELKRLMNPGIENDVRIQGMFREEIITTICYYQELGVDMLALWFMHKPDVKNIAVSAFRKFDTIKNSETYPFDTLACELIVSECVREYFEKVRESHVASV